ncbi:MAG: geranylgeranylglyceryl/heptaprenylglyceryl phosphate synthase [Schleiferiaceae bacterium]
MSLHPVQDMFTSALEKPQLAILIDPDKPGNELVDTLGDTIEKSGVSLIFLGGSLLTSYEIEDKISQLRKVTDAKIVMFPGAVPQVCADADATLFMSLLSGRNPELLIGQQVIAAPLVRQMGIEAVSTGYMIVDGGRPTTASYMSGSAPIPRDKPEIAACTAMAGEMLGMRNMYLDAGSGAQNHVPLEMISAVRKSVNTPIIVGGGIRTPQQAESVVEAGASIVVVGNATESNPNLIRDLSQVISA